jgi:glycerol-3-phosphate dehydrogenase
MLRPFSADTRANALRRMADGALDVLVIGGGITGAGVALDAASRGLSVGLIEREDFAAGTSGRSSRLIHGGLRYLEHLELALVAESVRERAILRRLAPHLVRPVPMYYPMLRARDRAYYRLGLTIYDALATGRNIGRHRMAGINEVHRAAPGLARPEPGGISWECRTDDARLTLEIVRTAAAHGALAANHVEAVGLLGQGSVVGATAADALTGERLEIRARVTVNATGVWADGVQALASTTPARLRPSKGVHLVFRPGAIATRVGMLVPSGAGDGRFLFVILWEDRVYVGTTDTEHHGDRDAPAVDAADRAYVLAGLTRAFPGVTETDIVASWAGLRPLLDREPGGSGSTADLSRRHAIFVDPKGLFTITGGKLTTWRAMAEDLVDRVVRDLGRGGPCRTDRIPLGLTADLDAVSQRAEAAAAAMGLEPAVGTRMVLRYGDDATEALRSIGQDRSLAEPLIDGLPVLKVEAAMARSREMAITDQDVLARRTRLTTLDASAAASAVPSAEAADSAADAAGRAVTP